MTRTVGRAAKRDSFIVAAAATLGLSAGSAFAADLPNQKAPAYLPPPPTWTGFYAGLNAGGAFGGSSSIQSIGADIFDDHAMGPASYSGLAGAISATGAVNSNAGGFIGGPQLGYNWQLTNLWVGGLEVDI